MPQRFLPARPNLEQLKNQAKDLLKAYRAGQPSARMRFRESLPRLRGASNDATRPSVSLRDAQHVIAVEYGFSNWSLMHAYIKEREDIVMLEMTVDRVAVNPNSQQRVVVLKAKEVSMYLPIWVGPAEGDSIMFKLRGEELPRPMTHDLMDSMISDLGARVTRVVVNAMQGDMFLGRIVLQRNGTTIERDSRPSDAIALAVRTGAAIYVEEEVLDRAGVSFDPETGLPTSTNANWTVRSIEEIDNAFSDEARVCCGRLAPTRHASGARRSRPRISSWRSLESRRGMGRVCWPTSASTWPRPDRSWEGTSNLGSLHPVGRASSARPASVYSPWREGKRTCCLVGRPVRSISCWVWR